MANGYIYILTNPSFPEYVKIGYADDVEKRLKQLNNSECIPFAFRVYATYEVNERLTDLKVHNMIDKINPNLRSVETVNGKTRKREFYAMAPEDAYYIFEAMAEISGSKDKLKLWVATEEEKAAEETATLISIESQRGHAEPITLEAYLEGKNANVVDLYYQLQSEAFDRYDDVEMYVLPQYIGWRKQGIYYAEIHLQRSKLMVLTRVPSKQYKVGQKLPDNYLWALSYRTYIESEDELTELIEIIKESYNQR